MTTYNILSTAITNRDATPKVLTDSYVIKGDLKGATGYVQTFGAADAAGTTYRMCSIPSNARIDSVRIYNDSLGTSCTVDVGVWWPTFIPLGAGLAVSNASKVINTTLFASVYNCSNVQQTTDITNQSGANTAILQETPLWNAAGLASDPNIDLDIVIYVHVAVQVQGYIGLKVIYAQS